MSSTLRSKTIFDSRTLGIIASACAAAALCGCMKMETQRTTLEHTPKVVRPEGDGETRVATMPEGGTQGGNDSFR
jgi:hypothetical protein